MLNEYKMWQLWRLLKIPSYHFIITLYSIAFLLSACTPSSAGAVPSHIAVDTNPSAVTHPASPKSDANGIATEASIRVRLLRVQTIMQGMSLEQKLGQLILVEYLGNSYQNSGLQ